MSKKVAVIAPEDRIHEETPLPKPYKYINNIVQEIFTSVYDLIDLRVKETERKRQEGVLRPSVSSRCFYTTLYSNEEIRSVIAGALSKNINNEASFQPFLDIQMEFPTESNNLCFLLVTIPSDYFDKIEIIPVNTSVEKAKPGAKKEPAKKEAAPAVVNLSYFICASLLSSQIYLVQKLEFQTVAPAKAEEKAPAPENTSSRPVSTKKAKTPAKPAPSPVPEDTSKKEAENAALQALAAAKPFLLATSHIPDRELGHVVSSSQMVVLIASNVHNQLSVFKYHHKNHTLDKLHDVPITKPATVQVMSIATSYDARIASIGLSSGEVWMHEIPEIIEEVVQTEVPETPTVSFTLNKSSGAAPRKKAVTISEAIKEAPVPPTMKSPTLMVKFIAPFMEGSEIKATQEPSAAKQMKALQFLSELQKADQSPRVLIPNVLFVLNAPSINEARTINRFYPLYDMNKLLKLQLCNRVVIWYKNEKNIYICDIPPVTSTKVASKLENTITPLKRSLAVASPITTACLSRRGDLLVTGHENGAVMLWDTKTATFLDLLLPMHSAAVKTLSFSNENSVLSSGKDGVAHVYNIDLCFTDASCPKLLYPIKCYQGKELIHSVLPSANFPIFMCNTPTFRDIYDAESGQLICTCMFPGTEKTRTPVIQQYSTNDSFIAKTCGNRYVEYNNEKGLIIYSLVGALLVTYPEMDAAFSKEYNDSIDLHVLASYLAETPHKHRNDPAAIQRFLLKPQLFQGIKPSPPARMSRSSSKMSVHSGTMLPGSARRAGLAGSRSSSVSSLLDPSGIAASAQGTSRTSSAQIVTLKTLETYHKKSGERKASISHVIENVIDNISNIRRELPSMPVVK